MLSSAELRHARLDRWPSVGEMNGESGFPWPVEIPIRQRWVKEWSSDCVDRKTAVLDLYVMCKRMVDDMHRKYGEANDSLESEQAEDGLIRVDMSSDSSSMEVAEDAQEQNRLVSPKEIRWEDPPTIPQKYCEAFHRRRSPAPAPAMETSFAAFGSEQ